MSFDVFETISIRGEEGPVVDFTLTDNSIKKYKDTITSCNDDVSKEEEDRTQKPKCHNCYKSFKRFDVLKKHLALCKLNSGYLIRKADMMKNIMKIEEDGAKLEKEDKCFCCSESYDTFHRGQINCPDCPKSFKTEMDYERHIFITHSEFDEFPCGICNAKLRTANLLKLHEDQHTNRGRLYACKICGRDFTRSCHLKRHQKYTSCAGSYKKAINCKVCNKVFSGLDSLRKHIKRHLITQVKKKREYVCRICKNSFSSLSILKNHRRKHQKRRFICEFCGKKFPSVGGLQDHRHSHTGEKPYICTECNKYFSSKSALNSHMRQHTGEKCYACSECNKNYAFKDELRIHMRQHTGEKPFTCTECSKSFVGKQGLKRHMMRHTGEKPYSCTECTKNYARNEELKIHMMRHAGQKPYSCTECNKNYYLKEDLKIHMRTHTGEKPYTCTECNKVFSFKSSFNRHMRRHNSGILYTCTECNQGFTAKFSLYDHMKRHTGEKPYTCIECNKSFAVKQDLNIHMKRHSSQKPYPCTECNKKYAVKDELKIHMRRHTGEKPFTCTECKQGFTRKGTLNIHMKRHTGEKPHVCSECGKRFMLAFELRSHSKAHVLPFACEQCEEKFKTNKKLEQHIRNHSSKNNHENETQKLKFKCEEINDIGVPIVKNTNSVPTDCEVWDKQFDSIKALNILETHEKQSQSFHNAKRDQKLEINSSESSQTAFNRIGDLNENQITNVPPGDTNVMLSVKSEELTSIKSENQVTEATTEKLLLENEMSRTIGAKATDEQISINDGVMLPLFIKQEIPETATENDSINMESETTVAKTLVSWITDNPNSVEDNCAIQQFTKENENYSIITIENKTIKTEPGTTVPEISADAVINNEISTKCDDVSQEVIGDKATVTSVHQLLFEHECDPHMRRHTGGKPFTCNECNKSFAGKQKLKIHMMRHTGEKPYTCDECNKSFTAKHTLMNHMRQHTGEKPFTCNECNQCFTRKDGLKIHMRRHTGEKPLTCKECNKSFAFWSSFNIHMKRHSGQKPYQCTKCNKSFTLKQGLNRHMIQHTGERPFTCTECNHSFAANYLLNIHMKRHTGEMPHVCNECGKRFVRAIELSYHSKIHVLPFACDQCEEKFKTTKKLEQHIRNHLSKNNHENVTQNHKFKCEEINDIGLHIVKNTNSVPTDCEVWDKRFDSIKALNSHIHETHKEQSQGFHNAERGQKLELSSSESSPTTFNNIGDLNENQIKNVPPADINVLLSVKAEELTSMKSGVQVTKATTEKLLLENEMSRTIGAKATDEQISINDGVMLPQFIKQEISDTATENDSINMESETTVPKTLVSWIKDNPISIEDNVAIQQFTKDNVPKTTKKNYFLENENYSIITLENKTIKTEPGTTVPDISVDAVINNEISTKCDDVSEELIGDKATETTAQQLLFEPELTVFKVQKNLGTKEGSFEYNCFKKKLSKLSVLNNHHGSHTGEKLYTCTECNKSFVTKQRLKIHMRRHTGEKPFTCNECNKSFAFVSSLYLHMKRHSGQKPYSCSECNKSFAVKQDLHSHMKRHNEEKPYSCTECSKKYAVKEELKIHMRQHTGEKPFTCTECNKTFAAKQRLNSHMKGHSNQKPYSCTECNKSYAAKQGLTIHMRQHTGEKPFTCTECDQSFAAKQRLIIHMKRHAGEKPHVCNECGKRFLRAIDLRYHSKTHLRPFICGQCEEKFKTNKEFEQHIEIHSSKCRAKNEAQEHKFKCKECEAMCATEEEFKIHCNTEGHKDLEKTRIDCVDYGKEFNPCLDKNLIENITTANKNVIHAVKYSEQRSIKGSVVLQKFIKDEVSETCTEQLILDNEEFTVSTLENQSIKTEPETIVSGSLVGDIMDGRTSIKTDVVEEEFIKEEVNETSTKNLL